LSIEAATRIDGLVRLIPDVRSESPNLELPKGGLAIFSTADILHRPVPHFSSIQLQAFRGLRDVTLSECADINLLIGKNNSGKTSVLEALALLCRPDDIAWWIDTLWAREIKSARTPEREVVKLLFPHVAAAVENELFDGTLNLSATLGNSAEERSVKAEIREQKLATRDLDYFKVVRSDGKRNLPPLDLGESRSSIAAGLAISGQATANHLFGAWHQFSEDGALPYPPGDPILRVPCTYVTTVAHRTESLSDQLGAALIKDRREALTGLLAGLQPTLMTFEAVPKAGQSAQIWLRDQKSGWLPLSVAGDGLRRAFHFAIAAANASNGILLIDEIESALHVSALKEVFGFLVRECRVLGVQLFATTHSLETVDAMVEESANAKESIAAFILNREGPARRVEGKRLRTMREEYGFDIR
jgi:ABC-type polar amino acid transport system ATPase subunit